MCSCSWLLLLHSHVLLPLRCPFRSIHSSRRLGLTALFGAAAVLTFLGAAAPSSLGADTRLVKVETVIQETPPQITVQWDDQAAGAQVEVFRRLFGQEGAASWGAAIATVTGPDHSYVDTNVVAGQAYEYKLYRPYIYGTAQEAFGYACSGIQIPLLDEDRGKMLLIVDETLTATLGAELRRLEMDLAGDGWTVVRHDFPRDDAGFQDQEDLRALIRSEYNADPTGVKSVLLFGKLPRVMSGYAAPDGHASAPHATDLFYADMDGTWTDTTNYGTANPPRDGQYDPSYIPGNVRVELQIGRVDLAGMGAWTINETELLRNYLRKDHAWRQAQVKAPARGIATSKSHLYHEDACLQPLFGAANVNDSLSSWIPEAEDNAYAWGVSFSDYNGSNYPRYDFKMTFTINFGSGKQKWEHSNNAMRALLCMPQYGLTCGWGGRPAWSFHFMGVGQTIGYSHYRTANNQNSEYCPGNYSFLLSGVWVNLMGDPSLRLHMIDPPTGLSATVAGSEAHLAWEASASTDVLGYHVYRSDSRLGPYTRLTPALLGTTAYVDSTGGAGETWHMVRAVRLESSPSGSYYNASQGAFCSVDWTAAAANHPPVAQDAVFETTDAIPTTITLNGSDSDGDPLLFSLAVYPQHGQLTGAPPSLVYTSDVNYDGSDSFTFTVWDGQTEDVGTVNILVHNVNYAPQTQSQETVVWADQSTTMQIVSSDLDGDALTYAVVTPPRHGTVTGGASLIYSPYAGYQGADSFVWQMRDGQAGSAPATATLTVLRLSLTASDNFDDGDFEGWSIYGNANWTTGSGELIHVSNSKSALAWDAATTQVWTGQALCATLRSGESDAFGTLCCFQDGSNYYGFEMSQRNSLRRLFKLVNNRKTTLAQDNVPYVTDQSYRVNLFMIQGEIIAQLDGRVILRTPMPADFSSGRAGLLSDANENSYFDDVELWRLEPSSSSATGWMMAY